MKQGRETFGSGFGSLMALLGVAVGLANVWRFPYMAGTYGGAAFVALYVLFGILLGIPAVMAEWTLGRLTRQGPAGAFETTSIPGGRGIGMMLFFTVFMANAYYALVVGQVLFYVFETFFGGEAGAAPQAFFEKTLNGITVANVAVTSATFIGMACVLYLGVRRGIETVSKIVVPVVFVLLLVVIARSVTLPGAVEGVRFFLLPDFSRVNSQTVLAALGQVFFSLSLGGTFFLLYGSYLPKDANIPRMAIQTAFGDLVAALLGGLAILPAVFAMGVEPTIGPSLLFVTLPGVCLRPCRAAPSSAACFSAHSSSRHSCRPSPPWRYLSTAWATTSGGGGAKPSPSWSRHSSWSHYRPCTARNFSGGTISFGARPCSQ